MTIKLLIAEDDRDLAEVIAYGARQSWPGCAVTIAADGQEALAIFAAMRPHLVILDVAMPPPNGIEVCLRMRQVSSVPILMLTVRGGMLDKVRARPRGRRLPDQALRSPRTLRAPARAPPSHR